MKGQVCDRCRRRKIKCDGQRPKCSRCAAANEECTAFATLIRKTTLRGYVHDNPARLGELEKQLEILREESMLVARREEQLRIQLLQREEELALIKKQQARAAENAGTSFEQQTSTVQPGTILRQQQQQSDPVIGHIGQMLLNENGREQILGAHTGVYFLSSATRQSRESLGSRYVSPDRVFGAFFSNLPYPVFGQADNTAHLVLSLRNHDQQHYLEQIQCFCDDWNGLYPILDLDDLTKQLSKILLLHRQEEKSLEAECCALFQLHAVLAINSTTHNAYPEELKVHDAVLGSLFPHICEIGNIESLRGLVLYTLVLQLEGRSQLAIQTNGIIVRLAQSLGLHRHSRRFKHQPSEIERRRRLWWCVFICDTNTSINRGLPILVRPADVDVDLSIQQLPVIIPGEAASPLGLFRQYISLYQIISETLDQLYTTWNRRGGVSKIKGLEMKLDSWLRTLEFNWDPLAVDGGSDCSESFGFTRLKILTEFTRILIHRPALSFEQSEPQFRNSLAISMETAERFLKAIQESQSPRD